MITEWVKEVARTPVLVKLTPNITDIRMPSRAPPNAAAPTALSAINTINSITGIDLDTFDAAPQCRRPILARRLLRPGRETDRAAHGAADRADPEVGAADLRHRRHFRTWRDAAEFILLGCGTVQVCTAAMHYGYRIVEDMIDGLSNWMDEKGFAHHRRFPRPLSLPNVTEWKHLDLNYKIVARIHRRQVHRLRSLLHRLLGWRAPVHPPRPHSSAAGQNAPPQGIAAEAPRRITKLRSLSSISTALAPYGPITHRSHRIPRVDEDECVGCNLCWLVCPVETASPWSKSKRSRHRKAGTNASRYGIVPEAAEHGALPNPNA